MIRKRPKISSFKIATDVMELDRPWPGGLVAANLLSLSAFPLILWVNTLRGEAGLGWNIIAGLIVMFSQLAALILLVIALIRRERPYWPYFLALLPVSVYLVLAAWEGDYMRPVDVVRYLWQYL